MALTPVANISADALAIDVQFIGAPGSAKNAAVRTLTRGEASSFVQGNAYPPDPARPYVLTGFGMTYVPRFHWWDILPTPREWGDEYLLPPPTGKDCIGVLAFSIYERETFTALQKITVGDRFTAVVLLAIGEEQHTGAPNARQVTEWEAFEWSRTMDYRYTEISIDNEASVQQFFSILVECARDFDEIQESELLLQGPPLPTKDSLNSEGSHLVTATSSVGEEIRQLSPQLRDASLVYDVAQLFISFLDLIFTFICMGMWFATGMAGLGGITALFLISANLFLTAFFVIAYSFSSRQHGRRWWHATKTFLRVLPFGLLVPTAILLYHRRITLVVRLFDYFGWSMDPFPPQSTDDPIYYHVRHMRRAHVGFCGQALLLSLPVSIINVVVMGSTPFTFTPINIVSFVLATIALLMKGPLLAYSIHRPTYMFGILCHMLDIYSIFALVSWMVNINGIDQSLGGAFTVVWIVKEVLLVIVYFAAVTLCYTVAVPLLIEFKSLTASLVKVVLSLAMFAILVGAFIPIVVVLEGFKFLTIPVIIFRRVDNRHGKNELGYNRVFAFLAADGFRERVYFLTRAVARQIRAGSKKSASNENEAVIEYLCTTPLSEFSLTTLRELNGYTVTGVYALLRWRLINYLGADACCLMGYIRFVMGFMAFFFAPLWFISALYSFFYPFLRLFSTPWRQQNLLPTLITIAIFLVIIVMCMLVQRVVHFRRAALYASVLDLPFNQPNWMDRMEKDLHYHQSVLALRTSHVVATANDLPVPNMTLKPRELVAIDHEGVLPPDALTPSTANIHRFEMSLGGAPVLRSSSPAASTSPRGEASMDPYNRRILVL